MAILTTTDQGLNFTGGSAFIKTGTSTVMSLTTSSDVGIGTTTPSEKLHVDGAGQFGDYLKIGTNVTAGYYQDSTNGAYRATGTSGNRGYWFQGYGGSGTTMYIGLVGAYASNVGIGTNTPSYKLQVHGGQFGTYLKGGDLGTGSDVVRMVKSDNSVAMLVRGDGNVGIGTPSPRYQLDLATPSSTTQSDYIGLGVRNGPSGGGGSTLGSGIIWKANYPSYTKRSAGIVQIAESNYFQSSLAFFTNGTADSSTDWVEAD